MAATKTNGRTAKKPTSSPVKLPVSQPAGASTNGKTPSPAEQRIRHRAGFGPPKSLLPPLLVTTIRDIENEIGMPVLLFLQDRRDRGEWASVDILARDVFLRGTLPNGPVAILIESSGGSAGCAFQIATSIRRRCGSFKALIADRAKSAATLLAMGAEEIIMAQEAHLGPLDAQVFDRDMVGYKSALEVVQSVEQLRTEGLSAMEATALMLKMGTGLPYTKVMSYAIESAAGLMRPLMEKVDIAEYTRMSRSLKVGEEYAIQLLEPIYGAEQARGIANQFVRGYPEHGFVITAEAAACAVEENGGYYGLNTRIATDKLGALLDSVARQTGRINAYGPITESKKEEHDAPVTSP